MPGKVKQRGAQLKMITRNPSRREVLACIGGVIAFPRIVIASPERKLKVGHLELKIVNPSDVPFPEEYVDSNNSRNPLIEVPEEYLDAQLTRHFKLGEFAIVPNPNYNGRKRLEIYKAGGKTYNRFIRLDPKLPLALQKLRDSFGSELTIISSYRTVTYNYNCGGEVHSQHKSGRAADVTPANGKSLAILYNLADKQFSNGGVGYYPYQVFVHVDVRGYRARWKK